MTTARVDLPDLAGKFYEAALNPALWPEALDLAARAFGARGAILPGASLQCGAILHSNGMEPVLDQFFSEGWHLRDERSIAAMRCDLVNDIVTDQLLFSAREMEQSRYYHGFARAAGVPWFCAATLGFDLGGNYVALSLQRSAAEGAFEAADLERLRQVMPHLRNATALALRLGQNHAAGVLAGLDHAGTPAAIVSRFGRVLLANQHFENLCHPALRISGGRVLAGRPSQQQALVALIEAVASLSGAGRSASLTGDPALVGPLILRGTEADTPLVLRAAPYRGAGADQARGAIAVEGVLITLLDPGSRLRQSDDLLRQLFDLTRREAQIMTLLGEGREVGQIALLLGITRETVRFHLKAILGKTGCHRQSEIVAICQRIGTG